MENDLALILVCVIGWTAGALTVGYIIGWRKAVRWTQRQAQAVKITGAK